MSRTLSDFQRKQPTFEWHKALILQILRNDPKAQRVEGLRDDEIADALALKIREGRIRKHEPFNPEQRKKPTVANRMRELAHQCQPPRVVRIKGLDGCKHNFHPDIFKRIAISDLQQCYANAEILKWQKLTEQAEVS